ncbi:MAG: heavy metal translocating P-type ATPase [bacterium]|nr:heavy metal translocating P-type ATPase [bacterium]
MKQYQVTGMSCAACSARVEKAVNQVDGVTTCAVSLLTNSMGVEGNADPAAIIAAVEAAGYGAAEKDNTAADRKSDRSEGSSDREIIQMRNRLIASLCFLLPLMYISMGHMMWGWPLPAFLEGNHIAMGLTELLLTIAVMVVNQKFFTNGFRSLFHLAPNMDTLVALGATASFGYSVYALYAMTHAELLDDTAAVMQYMHEFYFESAAMILTLITVGKLLEAVSKGRTTDALKGLMQLRPKTAVLLRDGVEQEVPIGQVHVGDQYVVRPGDHIPVDGIVLEGTGAVNESALTGESIPADKRKGDAVSAATTNQSGYLVCEATRVGEDTTLSQIIRMVSDAAATKAPIAKVADRVSGIFVPVVIGIALVTIAVWILIGHQTAGYALARGISVLVISCPCALGLATPVAIMVGNGMGAKHGIMFKTAVSLEETGRLQTVVLDKTGTITAGMPELTDLLPAKGHTVEELIDKAYALEHKSEHPLAAAIVHYAQEKEYKLAEIVEFEAVPGNGLTGVLNGHKLAGGKVSFITEMLREEQNGTDNRTATSDDGTTELEKIKNQAQQLSEEGKTPLYFSEDGHLLGIIAVADVIKEDSPQAIQELKNMGLRVVMLTGDNERTAQAIGRKAGVDEVIAGVLPDGKEAVISRMKKQGKAAMVGDGINDAPALTRADVGIAIGAGTDIAIDAADVVLMKNSLLDVPAAIRLSRATLRNIHENLFWAFIYNVIGIPLAAGVWIPLFGWTLNPMFGAAAMSLSSFCVVTNALRLNLFRMYRKAAAGLIAGDENSLSGKAKEEQKSIKEKEGECNMKEIRVGVEGMMCPMCEAHVNDAVRAAFDVKKVASSHKKKQTVIQTNAEISEQQIKEVIEKTGYQVTSFDVKE